MRQVYDQKKKYIFQNLNLWIAKACLLLHSKTKKSTKFSEQNSLGEKQECYLKVMKNNFATKANQVSVI